MPVLEQTERRAAGHAAVLAFYGLSEEPFGVTPDPRFLYFSPSHREALASLVYTTQTKRGFSALVAEPGMGKTTLLFHLLEKTKDTARTAFLFRPDGNARDLLESLLADLGVEAIGRTIPEMHEKLSSVLLEESRLGRDFIWVVDEAQDLDVSVLETIRLLSNFETPDAKLMHIILAGQPALAEKLAQPELLQLRQRVARTVQLSPFSARDTAAYIAHRLRLCGYADQRLFEPETVRAIASASKGIPRNINNLCFSCLSLGFVERAPRIGLNILHSVLTDSEIETSLPSGSRREPAPEPIPASNWWYEQDIDTPVSNHSGYERHNPRRWTWAVLIGFVLLPFGLVIAQANSGSRQFDLTTTPTVEAFVKRVTGYDVSTPKAPVSDVPALQAPAIPPNLSDLIQESPRPEPKIEELDALSTPPESSEPSTPRVALRQHAAAPATRAPRAVRAEKDQTIFQFAQKYYGKASWAIVDKLRASNPNIRESFATIKKGQVVVLPDLRAQTGRDFASSSSHPSL